ncbi:MAG: S-layer homology domain-containing protein [Defluviitaleaceae bacterium]|nr:S-layer homology domain-containing protein [Defluviitaleaceae bacterium]
MKNVLLVAIMAVAGLGFLDVPEDSWAAPTIEAAAEYGLMRGMGDGVFGYGQTITRGHFAIVVGNMFDQESEDLSDPNLPITRRDMAVMLVRALGYSNLAAQVESFEANPFTDVEDYAGYIIIAHHIGMISGVGEGLFAPNATATREQAAAMMVRVYEGLNAPLDWVHGFYAFGAFGQRHLIADMDAVSFGWSQMEWDAETGARLNTTAAGGNPWVIPAGYELIINYPRENGATTNLNVFMDTTTNLAEMIADPASRTGAVNAIYAELARKSFDGVTINFEGLRGQQSRDNFNHFLTELADALRPGEFNLYVTVHPTTIDGVYFDGYDLRTIGRLADRVILMVHDYRPRSMEGFLGTQWQRNAALTPINQVYRSLSAIACPGTGVEDINRVAIAFSFPNIGWFVDENNNLTRPTPVTVSMETVLTRMGQPDTYFGWCEHARNPYIIYTTEGGERVFLWYENHQSVAEKLQLARLFGIRGASVWRMGIIPNQNEWDVWENFR